MSAAEVEVAAKALPRRVSTSNNMATPQAGASINGGDKLLRPRSASSGKYPGDSDSSSKRKRDVSPLDASDMPDASQVSMSSTASDEHHENSGPDGPAVTGQSGPLAKRRKSIKPDSDLANDVYCWVCHKELITGQVYGFCKTCPRSYHTRCIPGMDLAVVNEMPVHNSGNWSCPECRTMEQAENIITRSHAMQLLTLDQLCTLLKFAMDRMKTVYGAEPFLRPVDPAEVPNYNDFVVNPMDLSLLERNVRRKQYGSTEAFLADAKWILHNSVIFNTCQNKMTSVARAIVKACRQEMTEIENCPDCYSNAHTRKESWFIEVCRRPHILVWAKLKGFPFWPAKAMKVNKESAVDVRFFGAHDRAWVPVRDCFLYSKEMPAGVKQKKKGNLDNCIVEVEQHAQRLKEKFGAFSHAPPRTPFDPEQQEKQLNMLLPNYRPAVDGKRARTILHPEIKASARTPAAKTAQGGASSSSSTSPATASSSQVKDTPDHQLVKAAKGTPKVVTTRSGRKSLAPKSKTLEPRVVIKKLESHSPRSETTVKKETFTKKEEEDEDEDEDLPVEASKEEEGGEEQPPAAESEEEEEEEQPQQEEGEDELAPQDEGEEEVHQDDEGEEDLSAQEEGGEELPLEDEAMEEEEDLYEEEDEMEQEDEGDVEMQGEGESPVPPMEEDEELEEELEDEEEAAVPEENAEEPEPMDPKSAKEEEAAEISAIIQASKAMEETLGQSAATSHEDSEESDTEVPTAEASLQEEDEEEEEEEKSQIETPEKSLPEEDSITDTVASKEAEQPAAEDEKVAESCSTPDLSEKDEPLAEENCAAETELAEAKDKVDADVEKPEKPSVSKEDEPQPKDAEETSSAAAAAELPVPKLVEPREKESEDASGDSATVAAVKPAESDKDKTSPDQHIPKSNFRFQKPIGLLKSNKSVSVEVRRVDRSSSDKSKTRSIPDLLSKDRKSDSYCEVQITPIPKVKRPVPIQQESASSDSDADVTAAKKSKTDETTNKKPAENAEDSPRPSNPDDDTIFPSLFLDPSVTITVVENDKRSNSGVDAAKELCASVNLSSDVSLTVVDKSKTGDKSRSSMSSPSPVEGSSMGKKPVPPLQTQSKARKSFSVPKPQMISMNTSSILMPNGTKSPPETARPSRQQSPMTQKDGRSGPSAPRGSGMMHGPSSQASHPSSSQGGARHSAGAGPLPQLQPKPLSGNMVPMAPPGAGPAHAEMHKHANKLTEYVRQTLETMVKDWASVINPQASLMGMHMEIEKLQWHHKQELNEIKHNADLVLMEMRASMDSERTRALNELRRQAEVEKARAIEETKRKQWCAYCRNEAQFYCCWNTSYCNFDCQQAHWPVHMETCAQKPKESGMSPNTHVGQSAYRGNTQTDEALELDVESLATSPSSSSTTAAASAKSASSKWAGKRKRCGQCVGCAVTHNCGVCAPCKNSRTHQVCRERRCRTLEENERQRNLAAESNQNKKNMQPKGLPPNIPLTQQQIAGLNAAAIPGGRGQHFALVPPRPMQRGRGGGMPPQFAMYAAGGSPRTPLASQTPHMAFPMQPHFFM